MEALAQDLRGRLAGRAIARIDLAAFSALKTFDPPLHGAPRHARRRRHPARQVPRHRRERRAPRHPPRPGRLDPVARRGAAAPAEPSTKSRWRSASSSTTTAGLDVTEAGTKKSLAIYVVRDPQTSRASPGSAPTRWPTTSRVDALARDPRSAPAASRSRACCGSRAPSPASATPTPTRSSTPRGCRRSSRPTSLDEAELQTLYDAIRAVLGDAGRALPRARRQRAEGREEVPPRRPRAHRPEVPGLRRHGARGVFADSSLQYCATCQTGGKPLADRRMSRLLK